MFQRSLKIYSLSLGKLMMGLKIKIRQGDEPISPDCRNSIFTYTIHGLRGGRHCGVGGDKGSNPFDSVAENRFIIMKGKYYARKLPFYCW